MDGQVIRELQHARNSKLLDLRTLARALGGEIVGGQVLCPGPGHSAGDRSLAVRPSAQSPFGFIAHSHAGDQWPVARDCTAALPATSATSLRGQRSRAAAARKSRLAVAAPPTDHRNACRTLSARSTRVFGARPRADCFLRAFAGQNASDGVGSDSCDPPYASGSCAHRKLLSVVANTAPQLVQA
jgi:hypothetical protein